jgi:hypothetical protein
VGPKRVARASHGSPGLSGTSPRGPPLIASKDTKSAINA